MQLSLDHSPARRKTSSERLQRAIERNRAKQAKREGSLPPKPAVLSAANRQIVSSPEESIFDRQLRSPRKKMPAELSYGQREIKKSLPKASPVKKVELKSSRPKIVGQAKSEIKKTEGKFKNKFIELMTYGGWICCLLLLVRLVVADRGVWHYYSRLGNFNQLQTNFLQIQDENQQLVEEIELISSDKVYQKKLIRDNLGFISSNEYLLLFSGHKRKPTSI